MEKRGGGREHVWGVCTMHVCCGTHAPSLSHPPQGAFGYFPTYTLGAMAAVQIFDAASKDIPNLTDDIAAGKFTPLREWLNKKVHALGSLPASGDALLELATGAPLQPELYVQHLTSKYKHIYKLE